MRGLAEARSGWPQALRSSWKADGVTPEDVTVKPVTAQGWSVGSAGPI